MKVRDVLQLLQHDGWYVSKVGGSHRQMKHHHKPGKVTVAVIPSMELHPKTLATVLRQAGMERKR